MEPPAPARKPIRVNLEARAATAERRRARTRERLLSAAEAVIAEKGVEAGQIHIRHRQVCTSHGCYYILFRTLIE